MRLYVDVGNTALKWRRRDGRCVEQGGETHQRHWDQALEAPLAPGAALQVVWVASVAGAEADQRIAQLIRQRTGREPHFYYSQPSDFGITSCYPEPRRLGVDRWVAMLECWHRFGAGIIIDCGSALTIDAIDEEGHFLGGYIVPGLGMLRNALLRDTADVHVEQSRADLGLGHSTGECVHNGLLRMSVAFVADVVAQLRTQLPGDCHVLVTGGGATELLAFFPFEFQHLPDLVLDGLERVAAREN